MEGIMKAIPTVQKYMTDCPHTIGDDITLKEAMNLMKEGNYRHLPVQHGGKLVGMVTDRDVKLAASYADDIEKLKTEEVMTQDPYSVSPDSPLDEVVATMAEKKYGAAVVVDNNKVVGIFTAVDGLRVLSEVLNQRFHK